MTDDTPQLNPEVTVLETRGIEGATSYKAVVTALDEGMPVECLGVSRTLSAALDSCWETDAHFVGYMAVDAEGNEAPLRINKRKSSFVPELIEEGGSVQVRVLTFDHDLDYAEGRKREWSGEELGEFVRGLSEGLTPYLPTHWYTTTHGSRFVFVLSEPVSPEAAEGIATSMRQTFLESGIEMDESCKDWTRLMRLPRTRRTDHGKWYEDSEFFMHVPFGEILDPSNIEYEESATQKYAKVSLQFGERPDDQECSAILYTQGDRGKQLMSNWHKRAKRQLNGSAAYPLCFDEVKLDELFISKRGFGGRNDGLSRVIGSMCGLLIAFDDTTEEHIYALLRSALEQMTCDCPDREDWQATGWDMICRMWEAEVSQMVAKQNVRVEQEQRATKEKTEILEGMRDAGIEEVPPEQDVALEYLDRRMIASDGTYHRIMKPDGTYTVKSFTSSILVAAIRDLGVDHLIQTHEMSGINLKVRDIKDILTDHAVPVSRVLMTCCETQSYIQGPPGDRELVTPIHQLDESLKAEFNTDIDQWLQQFFGDRYPEGIEWLSHCLKVQRPICSINLYGASGAGKGMFVMGIAECFRVKNKNDGKVLGRFNIGLAESPVVNFDEGLPGTMPGCPTVDQTFRVLTAGGTLSLEGKNKDIVHGTVYPRLIFTSNDLDIIQGIVGGRDLNEDDVAALEVRLLSFKVPHEAANFLMLRGQYAYTKDWVGQNSKHLLAKHIIALNEAAPAAASAGRFLVEGDRNSRVMEGARMQTDASQITIRMIVEMAEAKFNGPRTLCLKKDGNFWTTASGLAEFYETKGLSARYTIKAAGRVLSQLGVTSRNWEAPFEGAPKGRWCKIDLSIIIKESLAIGRPCTSVMDMYSEAEGIEALGELLENFNE